MGGGGGESRCLAAVVGAVGEDPLRTAGRNTYQYIIDAKCWLYSSIYFKAKTLALPAGYEARPTRQRKHSHTPKVTAVKASVVVHAAGVE